MPDYLFYPHVDDDTRFGPTAFSLVDDAAALRHADSMLRDHTGTVEVLIFQGERYVATRGRDLLVGVGASTKVLVVEDCFLQAQSLQFALEEAGCQVRCVGGEIQALVELDRERPDLALVDVNLGGEPSFAVAAAFEQAHVPLLFVTGYDQERLPARWRRSPYMCKPVTSAQVVDAVRDLLEQAQGSATHGRAAASEAHRSSLS